MIVDIDGVQDMSTKSKNKWACGKGNGRYAKQNLNIKLRDVNENIYNNIILAEVMTCILGASTENA